MLMYGQITVRSLRGVKQIHDALGIIAEDGENYNKIK